MKMKLKQTVILVTGACGQIGTELVRALRADQPQALVVATDLRPKEFMGADERYRQLNILNTSELERLIQYFSVTQIYHLAAVLSASAETSPLSSWDINMKGLLNVLEAAAKYKLRVFWPSSIAVFGPGSMPAVCFQNSKADPLTVYGNSKLAGEYWCRYYRINFGLDIRSIRYPGLISYSAPAGGGTTDYAVDIFHQALASGQYTCFLKEHTCMPMMYMPDAIRATLEMMAAPNANLSVVTSYNITGMSFTPGQLVNEIRKYLPELIVRYAPDQRQLIADGWPQTINDRQAHQDWGWQAEYDLAAMVSNMLLNLKQERRVYA